MVSESDGSRDGPRRSAGALIGLWILLFGLWLVVNATLALPVAIAGAVIAFAVAWIFCGRDALWGGLALTPRAAYHFLAYTGVFLVELVKANLNMLRYVYAPRIDIHPGIVKIHLRLKSPIGRLALANSIALTPGSLVMDVRGDSLFVHLLDVASVDAETATDAIAGPFEKHLEAAFG